MRHIPILKIIFHYLRNFALKKQQKTNFSEKKIYRANAYFTTGSKTAGRDDGKGSTDLSLA